MVPGLEINFLTTKTFKANDEPTINHHKPTVEVKAVLKKQPQALLKQAPRKKVDFLEAEALLQVAVLAFLVVDIETQTT